MSASSSAAWKYDVFLSFRGTDTRDGFTSYLYEALRLAEINIFIDNKLERGEEISTSLLREIESSRISVVIFSQNYAFSPHCLDELVKIIECKEFMGQSVFPIFYKVNPDDITELKGCYERAFVEHEGRFKEEKDKLEKWKSALREISCLSGWHITDDKNSPKCIRRVVLAVLKRLNEEKERTLVTELQELQTIEANINSLLENGWSFWNERQKIKVGIWLGNAGRIKSEAQSMQREFKKCRWTMQFGDCLKRMIKEVRELVEQKGRILGPLATCAAQINEEAFPTKEMVGRNFQINMNLIWEWLSSDEVSSIGIYGMGGVGKTTLVTHIHNKLLEKPRNYAHVYWVTMSQDFSIYKLQSLIAKAININFDNEEDMKKRAARLSKELNKRHNFVLILDDLWSHFDVGEVGIPIENNGCKLLVTTRSIEVCKRINCQKMEKIMPLNEEEAWNLFLKTFGCNLSLNIEMTAKAIARECAGLPLAIVTMAGSMRGVDDLDEWENALTELQSSIVRQEDMEGVFQILRYSFTRLNDPALQQCLLYCALFPEDYLIPREEVIEHLIVEGIIDQERDTRQGKLNKGNTMLNKLVYVSLLERVDYGVKMHDLIRDVAIQIMSECLPSIVESGKQLQCIPDEKYWKEDIVRVSLMKNDINEIPSSFSPSCPYLSTLLLSYNWRLQSLADSFFDHLQGLQVLDLSRTRIEELPESIRGLKKLSALFLRSSSINYIPMLANFKLMELLDLRGCSGMKKVPEGLVLLSNLRYLNLLGSGIMEFPHGILPKLIHLQFLAFLKPSDNAEEIGGLRRLETLYWCFPTTRDLNIVLRCLSKMPTKQIKYTLSVGSAFDYGWTLDEADRIVTLNKCTMTRELRELPFRIDSLALCQVSLENGRGLCLQNPIGLKSLRIEYCRGMEYLFSLSTSPSIFQSLEILLASRMNNLNALFSDLDMMVPPPPSSTLSFGLKELKIYSCSVKKLLPHYLLPNLHNLERIDVQECRELEEIISVEGNVHTLPFNLPKLRYLYLIDLPKLKRICMEEIKCDCLQSSSLYLCSQLKSVSISLPLPYLESLKIGSTEWWASVKWGQPKQKDALPYEFVP